MVGLQETISAHTSQSGAPAIIAEFTIHREIFVVGVQASGSTSAHRRDDAPGSCRALPLPPSQTQSTCSPTSQTRRLSAPTPALIRYIFNKTLEHVFVILLVITNLSRYNHHFIMRKIRCPHLDNLTSTFQLDINLNGITGVIYHRWKWCSLSPCLLPSSLPRAVFGFLPFLDQGSRNVVIRSLPNCIFPLGLRAHVRGMKVHGAVKTGYFPFALAELPGVTGAHSCPSGSLC